MRILNQILQHKLRYRAIHCTRTYGGSVAVACYMIFPVTLLPILLAYYFKSKLYSLLCILINFPLSAPHINFLYIYYRGKEDQEILVVCLLCLPIKTRFSASASPSPYAIRRAHSQSLFLNDCSSQKSNRPEYKALLQLTVKQPLCFKA